MDLGETARKLARNPLGVISFFLIIVYLIAGLFFNFSSETLSDDQKWLFVFFMVLFPPIVFGFFVWLVVRHPTKLYAPSDWKNESHYLRAMNVDGPGTKEEDISTSAITGIHKEITQKADGEVEFGWLKTKGDIVEVTKELEITCDPEIMTFENKPYPIGQQLHFAVVNGTSKDLVYPLCSIEFTSQFKHLHTENPATGIRTINSDLWGMSGRLTELQDISISTMEISSILARVLRPGQFVKFFVRFELPKNDAKYNLRMKLKAKEKPEETKNLILKVKA